MAEARDLRRFPVHLGTGASACMQPQFTGGMDWYADYAGRTVSDGAEGRLVARHDFTESWDSWEMHPHGDEVVICVAGTIDLIQELPGGGTDTIRLTAGDYAINPAVAWHTADADGPVSVIFITAGLGTEHRPR